MCLIDFGVKSLGLLGIEISQGCSMFIQRVFATRLFASLMHPLLVYPTAFIFYMMRRKIPMHFGVKMSKVKVTTELCVNTLVLIL